MDDDEKNPYQAVLRLLRLLDKDDEPWLDVIMTYQETPGPFTDLEVLKSWRGRTVVGTLAFGGEMYAVEGRLDAVGFITPEKLMVAIGDPKNEADGRIYMLPNDATTVIMLEVKGG